MKSYGITALAVVCSILLSLLCSCADSVGQTQPVTDEIAATLGAITSPIDETEAQTDAPATDSDEISVEKPIEVKRLSFIGMGDNLIHRPIYRQSETSPDKSVDDTKKTYDFLPKYSHVADMIASADVAFINQETPMCGGEYGYSNYPQFNTPRQMGLDLVTLGFDIIGFANNHMNDKGAVALGKMIDFTDTLDAMIVGLYRNGEDFENIRVYEKDGVKIAVLAYTYGTNLSHPSSSDIVIPVYSEEILKRQIPRAREVADVVIVSMHWGNEERFTVSDEQKEYAQLIADLGADVILGHHPHVIQPVQWLEGKDGGKTLCYYSLGNGISNQDRLRNMVGVTASFDIVLTDGVCSIENASVIPTFCYQTTGYKNTALYLLEELTEDMAKKHHCNSKGDNVTVDAARKIVTDNIDEKFLPDYLRQSND